MQSGEVSLKRPLTRTKTSKHCSFAMEPVLSAEAFRWTRYEDIDVPWGPLDSDGEDALDPGGEDEEYSDIERMPEDLVRRSPRTTTVGYMLKFA